MRGSLVERAGARDRAWQQEVLEGVARTFALTLRQLPEPLRDAAGNLYLLCRIADTIEDEPALSPAEKDAFCRSFRRVLAGAANPADFASELGSRLSPASSENDRTLIASTPRVLRLTARLGETQQAAMRRCVRIMSRGMVEFQRIASLDGLPDMAHLDRYCYRVAGVVGETLTALFCDYSAEIGRRRERLLALSLSFGQGLQMINVLKDHWEDRRRGACWLPRDLFRRRGVELGNLTPDRTDRGYRAGLLQLVGITRQHLADALRYLQLIPARETGIRLSCIWPVGIALLTLQRIRRNPGFTSGRQVKVSRREVWAVVLVTRACVRSNLALRLLFKWAARGLPRVPAIP